MVKSLRRWLKLEVQLQSEEAMVHLVAKLAKLCAVVTESGAEGAVTGTA